MPCPRSARYLDAAERAYGWFLGDNDIGLPVAPPGFRRLPRRPGAGWREPQPGGRIDAHVADRPGAHARSARTRRNSIAGHGPARGTGDRAITIRGLEARRLPCPQARGDDHGSCAAGRDILFERHPANPLITAADLPYRANSVFNPGAARVDGDTVLLLRVEDLRGISHLQVARSTDGVTDWRIDPRAAAGAATRALPGGGLGLRGPAADLAPRARGVGDRVHGLQPPRSTGVARDDTGLHRGPPPWPGHAARGQGRRALPAPHRRTLGDDPPAVAAAGRRPHLDLLLARPPALGRPRAAARGARTAPGGMPARSGSGRRRWRPPRAGWSATTASTPRPPVRSTASGLRCSTSRTRASSSTGPTSG